MFHVPLRMQKQTRYTQPQLLGFTKFEAHYERGGRIPAKYNDRNQGEPP